MADQARRPAADEPRKARGRLLREAAAAVLVAVIFASAAAFIVGILAGITPLFLAGVAVLGTSALAADLATAASVSEPGDDPGRLRTRRGLALAEVVATMGWYGVALLMWYRHGQGLVFALATAAGGALIVGLFRALRREHGVPDDEPLGGAPPSEVSPEQAQRFWAERNLRRTWVLLTLLEAAGLAGGILAGVLLGGDTLLGALLVAVLVFAPVALLSWRLHVRFDIPLMTMMPARPPPDSGELPETVLFRPGAGAAATVAFALAFVVGMLGLIVLAEGRKGPEPAIGPIATALIAAALVATGACAVAVFFRVRQIRLEVGPDGLQVVNFRSGRFVRWEDVAQVETATSGLLGGMLVVASTLSGHGTPLSRGVQIQLKGRRPIRVGAIGFADPHRHAGLQAVLVALRREGAAHGVPVEL